MLAQHFKTAEELGISSDEFDALLKVLGMLERGELTHVIPKRAGILPNYDKGFTGHFNMIREAINDDCGTVACILGTARVLFGMHLFPGWEGKGGALPKNLHSLFFPISVSAFKLITTDQAAIALRNYLTSGDPLWKEAIC